MDALVARAAIDRFERPSQLDDVHRLLHEAGGTARLLGGGTDLALHPPRGVSALIDLSALPLSYIERRDRGIAIGATTTLAAIERHADIAGLAGNLLGSVLADVGSQALRNVATVGGHLARGHLSDLVPALLVLDAELTVHDGSEHTVSLADFYDDGWYKRPIVICEVMLPATEQQPAAAFLRFSRTVFDYAILNCAVALQLTGSSVQSARVAVGETPALARRVGAVEQFLIGRELDHGTISEAAAVAQAHVETGSDQRASAGYRRHLVGVGVRRALHTAAGDREPEP